MLTVSRVDCIENGNGFLRIFRQLFPLLNSNHATFRERTDLKSAFLPQKVGI